MFVFCIHTRQSAENIQKCVFSHGSAEGACSAIYSVYPDLLQGRALKRGKKKKQK